ncbi:flagellar hook-associated protein 3 FlgL [Gammaproteobacteria bacterium]
MRISTAMFHQQSITSMLNAQSQLDETQQQLATGRRMLNPSDDPAASSQALSLRQTVATTEQYQNNADTATARLNLEESSLTGVGNVLQRVRELALKSNNADLTNSDRHAIAVEMRQNFDALVGLANTRDANGEYLFSGYNTQTQPFNVNANKVSYMGDQGSRFLQIGESDQVATGDSGWNVFMNIPTGNGNGLFVTAPGPNNSGSGAIDPGTVVDQNTWKPDSYTISFPTADTYEVRDSAGGLVPGASGAYSSGDAIAFRGIQTTITGDPIVGDSFTITSVGPNPTNSGTGAMNHSTVVDSTAWQQDIYTLSFSSANDYQIQDSAGKLVGNGTYQSGNPITFRGIRTSITGAPAIGDSFVIAPGTQQDVFSTINTLATTLENTSGPQTNSTVANAVSRAIQDLDQAHARTLDTRSAIGSRLNRVSNAKDSNEGFSIQLHSTLSTLEDLDYTTAVSTLNLQTLGLQAAQQAYVKVSGLSLFSHLG